MRVALLPLLVGVVTFSRTNRAVRAVDSVCIVRLDRLPVTETAVEKLVPSVLVWMLKEPVFQPVFSAPRPACLTTNRFTVWLEPRSTVSDDGEVSVQNLLLLMIRPSTAIAADSLAAQAACGLVTDLLSAMFVPSSGAVAGGVKPWLNDGGTSPDPVPHELPELLPMVKLSVPPAAMSRNRMKFWVRDVPLSEKLCTNCAPWPAPEALIWTLPPGRWMRTDGNSGPCRASVSAPGVAGYMPSAAQTYHADVAPRSSLPGRPPAPVVYDSFITRRTAADVPAGLRAKLYAHGTPCSGSLPM